MQASKIMVGGIYAVYRPHSGDSKELVRLRVTAVVQRRNRNTGSPHDYSSTVEGVIIEDHLDNVAWAERAEDGTKHVVSFKPDAVLGLYTEQAELVERKRRQDEATQAEKEARKQDVDDLRRLLYALVGEPMPNDSNSYKQMFRDSFGSGLDIKEEGVKRLLAALKQREG